MAWYQYGCPDCGASFEARRTRPVLVADDTPETCSCGGAAGRSFVVTENLLQVPMPFVGNDEFVGLLGER